MAGRKDLARQVGMKDNGRGRRERRLESSRGTKTREAAGLELQGGAGQGRKCRGMHARTHEPAWPLIRAAVLGLLYLTSFATKVNRIACSCVRASRLAAESTQDAGMTGWAES